MFIFLQKQLNPNNKIKNKKYLFWDDLIFIWKKKIQTYLQLGLFIALFYIEDLNTRPAFFRER